MNPWNTWCCGLALALNPACRNGDCHGGSTEAACCMLAAAPGRDEAFWRLRGFGITGELRGKTRLFKYDDPGRDTPLSRAGAAC